MRARVVGVLVLAVLLVAGLGSVAFAAATCTTYDAQNLPTSTFRGGEKIIVRGTGFGPNARVLISLQQGTRTIQLSGANANDLGAFAATDAVIPASVAAGAAAIRAIDARGSATCGVTLEAAAEEDDGVSGVFWIWGALLAVFAVILGVLTYRRWKTERLKEAVDSLALRERYDARAGAPGTSQRVAVGSSHPLPLQTRPDERRAPQGFDLAAPPREIRPRDVPRAPQVFDPVRAPMRGGFDESMRSTAPFPSADDDDSPIGAPLPFDDRFAVDDSRRDPARGRMSPDRDEVAWQPERPIPTRDLGRERHDGGGAQAFDPTPRRDAGGVGYGAHRDEREPIRPFHVPDVRDALEPDESSSLASFFEEEEDGREPDDRPFAHPIDHVVGHEATAPDRPAPARPVVEAAEPERARSDMDRPAERVYERDVPAPSIAPRSVADGPDTSFAEALREFLAAEDEHADPLFESGPADRHPAPVMPPPAPVEPGVVDRPFPPTPRPMPVAPPPAEPTEREDEASSRGPIEPIRTAESTAQSEPTNEGATIESIQTVDPREPVEQIEPYAPHGDRSPEPRPAHPAVPLRFTPRAPRPPAAEPGPEHQTYRSPPQAGPPRTSTRHPPSVEPARERPDGDEREHDPPALPVGWDDGRLRPSHKRSSDAIERLRREVRDWRR